jgi:hypothetical protein
MEAPPHRWDCERVGQWLTDNGFQKYRQVFEDRKIDGETLCGLTENSLMGDPLNITVLSDVKTLHASIQRLKKDNDALVISNTQFPKLFPYKAYEALEMEDSENSFDSDKELLSKTDDNQNTVFYKRFHSDLRKAVLAVLYGVFCHFMTSVAIVNAQEKLPDKKRYPPLPDIYLDNFAVIPWAYKVSESVIISLLVLLGLIFVFHKHRYSAIYCTNILHSRGGGGSYLSSEEVRCVVYENIVPCGSFNLS